MIVYMTFSPLIPQWEGTAQCEGTTAKQAIANRRLQDTIVDDPSVKKTSSMSISSVKAWLVWITIMPTSMYAIASTRLPDVIVSTVASTQ